MTDRLADTVTTDDLVNSLLASVATPRDAQPSAPLSASTTDFTPAIAESSSPSNGNNNSNNNRIDDREDVERPRTPSPVPTDAVGRPLTLEATPETIASRGEPTSDSSSANGSLTPSTNATGSSSRDTSAAIKKDNSSSSASSGSSKSSNGAVLSVGIAVGILLLVVAAVLFLRSRRRRRSKSGEPLDTTFAAAAAAGAAALTVPTDRGFQKEHDLGLPELSIELSPGHLGLSKGFDLSCASSTRSSAASYQPNASVASSSGSSVFNTKGGVSPTGFGHRKGAGSFSYRESEDERRPAATNLAASTTFHLTGLIGNGQTSRAGGTGGAAAAGGTGAAGAGAGTGAGALHLSRGMAKGGRKLSAPDEYAELATTTSAYGKLEHTVPPTMVLHADFTQSGSSQNELDVSMGPDGDNFSFVAPLPVRAPVPAIRRASDESLGPDSPLARSSRRPGPVYGMLPARRQQRSEADEEVDLNGMSTVSFLSESSLSSTSTRDSLTTSMHASAYESFMPLLQQSSSADDSDYGEEVSLDRASMTSAEQAKMARSGSLIALKLEAHSGASEIAI